jgi:hypothetical protein
MEVIEVPLNVRYDIQYGTYILRLTENSNMLQFNVSQPGPHVISLDHMRDPLSCRLMGHRTNQMDFVYVGSSIVVGAYERFWVPQLIQEESKVHRDISANQQCQVVW